MDGGDVTKRTTLVERRVCGVRHDSVCGWRGAGYPGAWRLEVHIDSRARFLSDSSCANVLARGYCVPACLGSLAFGALIAAILTFKRKRRIEVVHIVELYRSVTRQCSTNRYRFWSFKCSYNPQSLYGAESVSRVHKLAWLTVRPLSIPAVDKHHQANARSAISSAARHRGASNGFSRHMREGKCALERLEVLYALFRGAGTSGYTSKINVGDNRHWVFLAFLAIWDEPLFSVMGHLREGTPGCQFRILQLVNTCLQRLHRGAAQRRASGRRSQVTRNVGEAQSADVSVPALFSWWRCTSIVVLEWRWICVVWTRYSGPDLGRRSPLLEGKIGCSDRETCG